MSDLCVIPRRFYGPPASGNGGYVAGMLAAALLRRLAPAAPVAAATLPGDAAGGPAQRAV